MSSFLPVVEEQQEIDAIRNQISGNEPMTWPTIGSHPLSEYETIFSHYGIPYTIP